MTSMISAFCLVSLLNPSSTNQKSHFSLVTDYGSRTPNHPAPSPYDEAHYACSGTKQSLLNRTLLQYLADDGYYSIMVCKNI